MAWVPVNASSYRFRRRQRIALWTPLGLVLGVYLRKDVKRPAKAYVRLDNGLEPSVWIASLRVEE